MTRALLLLIISAGFAFEISAQTKSTVDSIYYDAIDFLKSNGGLEARDNLQEYKKRIYFFELIREELLSNKDGIYVFGISSSETKRFLMILDKGKWKIYNTNEMSAVFAALSEFFSSHKVTNAQCVQYTGEILKIYQYNNKY